MFCLTCIRQWRNKNGKELALRESNAIKECPCCRTASMYVVPASRHLIGTQKELMIASFKDRTGRTPCKYFVRSRQNAPNDVPQCPFGDECIYSHRDASGNRVHTVKSLPQKASQRQDIYFGLLIF